MSSALAKRELRSLWWNHEKDCLMLIDQRLLPHELKNMECHTVEEAWTAIRKMAVRGAPAIGGAAALGMVLASESAKTLAPSQYHDALKHAKKYLDTSRPTAVNLMWATGRMLELCSLLVKTQGPAEIHDALKQEALQLCEDDIAINKALGAHGATVVRKGANFMHHCNTGSLATVSWGTALGIIYSSHQQGKDIHVWVNETRPRLQGGRLTAWELKHSGVPMHLVADNAAASLLASGKVDLVVVGADRVAANGDVANKIGTHGVALLAHHYGVPVYVGLPTSTIDLSCRTGASIKIEERGAEEVLCASGHRIAPEVPVFNPAFDVTPSKFITGFVTEHGILYPPFDANIRKVKEKSERLIRETWEKRKQNYMKKQNSELKPKL